MSDTEIGALRAMLLSRPRPAGLAERRQRLDALGAAYCVWRSDVDGAAGGAPTACPAEWTLDPGGGVLAGDPCSCTAAAMSAGSIASHAHLVAESRAGRRGHAPWRWTTAARPSTPSRRRLMTRWRGISLPALSLGVAAGAASAIAGDSAGGGMTLAALVTTATPVMKPPGCAPGASRPGSILKCIWGPAWRARRPPTR